jgi:hypothetical protein
MITLTATTNPDLFHLICRQCLWMPGTPLNWDEATTASAAHGRHCPGTIPPTTPRAQINRAKKLLSGNY